MAFSFPTSVKRRTDCLSMILAEDVAEQHMLAWRQELGELDPNNPLVTPAMPWDAGSVFAHGTFAHDPIDGLWKAWHVSTPLTAGYFENYRRVTYLTSEDGVEWTRPELDLCPQPGHPRTNILLDFESGGPSMYSSVMIDPDAEPDRRYEMFVMRDPGNTIGGGPGHIRGLPPPPPGEKQARGMYRYFSPDGIHWTVSEGPVLEVAVPGVRLVIPYENPKHTADTTYVFRDADGAYFATHKLGEPAHPGGLVAYDIFAEGRRVMARRTSPDGSEWSPFETIIQPDIYDPHDVQIMEPLRHAGAERVHRRDRHLPQSHADHRAAAGRQRRRAYLGPARAPARGRGRRAGRLRRRHAVALAPHGRAQRAALRVLLGHRRSARRPGGQGPDDLAVLLRHLPRQLGRQSVLGGGFRPRWRRGRHADHAPVARRRPAIDPQCRHVDRDRG